MKLIITILLLLLPLFGCAHSCVGHSFQEIQDMMANDAAKISFAMIVYHHDNGVWPSSLSDLKTYFSNLVKDDATTNEIIYESLATLDKIDKLSISVIDEGNIGLAFSRKKLYEASTNLKANKRTEEPDYINYSLSLIKTRATFYVCEGPETSGELTRGQKIGFVILEQIFRLLEAYSKDPF